jgi:hypothetical protein
MDIFVFGSNTEGRHGKGAALEARNNWGAIYGQARGLQGRSYAIVTKELRKHLPDITLAEIYDEVGVFIDFASRHPEHRFILTPIGCGLAGFSPEQIAPFFSVCPKNIVLPKEFL